MSRLIELNSPNASQLPQEYLEHGGQAHMIQKDFFKAKDWVDFSASINPLGLTNNIEHVIKESFAAISRYPDPQCTELKQALSNYLGTEESRIVITNGATELIYLLPHLRIFGRFI